MYIYIYIYTLHVCIHIYIYIYKCYHYPVVPPAQRGRLAHAANTALGAGRHVPQVLGFVACLLIAVCLCVACCLLLVACCLLLVACLFVCCVFVCCLCFSERLSIAYMHESMGTNGIKQAELYAMCASFSKGWAR